MDEELESSDIATWDFEAHTGRFCANCKFLLGVRYNFDSAEKWHCVNPNNINRTKHDLVTGKLLRDYIVPNIYLLREDSTLCGPTGNWYEEYEPPQHEQITKINKLKRSSLKHISVDDL